jgi:hypothetical protein
VDLQATTLGASEREEAASVVACSRERVGRIDPGRLAFVDERGSNVGLVPLRAGAPSGERASGKAPRKRGKNTTRPARLKALLRREALVEAMGRALDAVPPEKATEWFAHCGCGFARPSREPP